MKVWTQQPVLAELLLVVANSQDVSVQKRGDKQAHGIRVADGAIRMDGRLDEDVWSRSTPLTDFVQKEPIEGAPPTSRMEVRFLYDSTALFIGAQMSAADGGIQAPLGRRDDAEQAEHIAISLDTHFDGLTAYTFGATASGVRLDHFHPRDDHAVDAGYDPVWEARTTVVPSGWSAELWIPVSQLRYSDQSEQVWGLNIYPRRSACAPGPGIWCVR